jgi:hypothetical protein
MALENYTEPMQEILNGSLIPGVDMQLTNSVGGFWYVMLFGLPIVMSYLKTEDITIPTVLMLWSITLYGYLIDPMLSTIATLTLAGGVAIMFLKVFWRDN